MLASSAAPPRPLPVAHRGSRSLPLELLLMPRLWLMLAHHPFASSDPMLPQPV